MPIVQQCLRFDPISYPVWTVVSLAMLLTVEVLEASGAFIL